MIDDRHTDKGEAFAATSVPPDPDLSKASASPLLLLILLAGLALRLGFALLPLRFHLLLLEDDAWMVTAIARNFARGLGPSADGVSWTTGFQPLYPLTLGALPYVVAPNALDAGFTANLVICAVLSALACLPAYALAKRLGGELAGLFAAALLALNPFMVRLTVNGMETSLGLLLLLTLFWMALRVAGGGRPTTDDRRPKLPNTAQTPTPNTAQTPTSNTAQTPTPNTAQTPTSNIAQTPTPNIAQTSTSNTAQTSTSNTAQTPTSNTAQTPTSNTAQGAGRSTLRPYGYVVGLGMVTALAVLARLDASLAFAAIALNIMIAPRPRTGAGLGVRATGLRTAAVYIVTTLLLLTPYFAFNDLVGGGLGPASGRALMFMQSYAGSFNLTNGLAAWLQNSALNLDPLPGLWPKLLVWALLIGAFVWLIGRRARAALPLLLYLPVPALYYGYYLQQIRERYFVGVSAVLIIMLAWLLAELWQRAAGAVGRVAVVGALCGVVLLNSIEPVTFARFIQTNADLTQPTSYQAALWIRDNLPPDARIGAKNSGIYQYYSGHTILNIDGKLNHQIIPQLERRTLLNYLRAERVTFLVDRETTMADHVAFYSVQFGPAPFHHTPGIRERLVIYGTLLRNRLGARLPVPVDRRDGFVPDPPFAAAAEILVRFPRPNQADNPVVVYQLRPPGAPGVP